MICRSISCSSRISMDSSF